MNRTSRGAALTLSAGLFLLLGLNQFASSSETLLDKLENRHQSMKVIRLRATGTVELKGEGMVDADAASEKTSTSPREMQVTENWLIDVPGKSWQFERRWVDDDQLKLRETRILQGKHIFASSASVPGAPPTAMGTPLDKYKLDLEDYPLALMLGVIPLDSQSAPIVTWVDPRESVDTRVKAAQGSSPNTERLTLTLNDDRTIFLTCDANSCPIEFELWQNKKRLGSIHLDYETRDKERVLAGWTSTLETDDGVVSRKMKVDSYQTFDRAGAMARSDRGVFSDLPWNQPLDLSSIQSPLDLATFLSDSLGEDWVVLLDEESFQAAKKSINDPLKLKTDGKQTVRELLYDGLRANGLDFIASEGELYIVPRFITRTQYRSLSIFGPLADPIDSTAMIQMICDEVEPEDWDFMGGIAQIKLLDEEGMIVVSHAPSDLIRVGELLSRFLKDSDK